MNRIIWDQGHPHFGLTAIESFEEDPAADFIRWSAVQFWTADEATALSFGLDPRLVNPLSFRDKDHPFAEEYDRRRDLITRAVAIGQLPTRPSPVRCINWAKKVGLQFPIDLEMRVKAGRRSAQLASATTSPSGLTNAVKKDNQIALGIAKEIYGFDPKAPSETVYQEIVDDLLSVSVPMELEALKDCLKPPGDLYESLPAVRETLCKVIYGMALKYYQHTPAAPRSKATKAIAKVVSVDDATVLGRLRKGKSDLSDG
jgi:hypothetical protein